MLEIFDIEESTLKSINFVKFGNTNAPQSISLAQFLQHLQKCRKVNGVLPPLVIAFLVLWGI